MSRVALSWPPDGGDWLRGARRVASPNFDRRPPGTPIDLLVVHYISLPPERFSGDAIERFFTNRLDPRGHPFFESIQGLRVSAHFLIRRRGELLQFVGCDARAWHAGPSEFRGRSRCNDFSIGVELEGSSNARFTQAQYRRLARLATLLSLRYPLRWVAGHSDIAPGRKEDPGPLFDWNGFMSSVRHTRLARPFAATDRVNTRSER